MGIESVTDESICKLLSSEKQVVNPNTRKVDKRSHYQKNLKVESISIVGRQTFTLYTRQNKRADDDFSCGLLWHMPSGESLTLVRYNGSSHFHRNRVEGDGIDFSCHIHKASQKYIELGLKPEGFAEKTTRYHTLSGALHYLVCDYNISGLSTQRDQPLLF